MAIKETELVTLNGNTTAFGGRIYNANYQIGFNESPSSVRLSIINESGIYNISEDDLTVLGSPDILSFGGRDLKMFPIEYSVDKSDGGKILSVEYVDSSVRHLDKKFVVLNGTHIASKSNGPNDALITVGKKYWSDEIEDSEGVYVQTLVESPPNDFDLGNSFYYVSELYEQMQAHGIPMHSSVGNILLNKDGADSYLNNVVGTLRNVLLTWGNIMAFAFYWGEDNKLHFIDLESNVNVDLEKLEGIIPFSDEESYSLKDTVDRGYSLYYGKAGKAQTESDIGASKTSFFFKRGIFNLSDSDQTGIPQEITSPLELIKASSLGESFFLGYSLYLALPNGGNSQGVRDNFGFSNFENHDNDEALLKIVDPLERYRGNYSLFSFSQDDAADLSWGIFNEIIQKILTFELPMKESDRENFNSWSVQFNYDYQDDTNYINPNTSNSSGDDPEHRAYFVAPNTYLFIVTPTENSRPEEFALPIDFANEESAQSKGVDLNKRYIFVRKNVDWNSAVDNITFRENRNKFKVDGFNVKGGAFNSITPKLEKIFIKKPSYNSNTIATDMQIDSTDDNEIALAGRSFEGIASILNESYVRAEKSFRKSFSVTGISLPQKITPEDGLQSISISNTNERGTTSTYTIGNTFFKIPSKDIILQKLEREKFAELRAKNRFSFIFNAGGFNV